MSLQQLIDEYTGWNRAQGLNLGSADEHLNDDNLTGSQRAWLADFCVRWDACAKLASREARIVRPDGSVSLHVPGSMAELEQLLGAAIFDTILTAQGWVSVVEGTDGSDLEPNPYATELLSASTPVVGPIAVSACDPWTWRPEP